jgi:hypothetical protein
MNAIYRVLPLILIITLAGCFAQDNDNGQPTPTQDSVRQVAAEDLEIVKGQTVYVPTYSSIFFIDTKKTWNLAVTLAIRNTDADQAIIVKSARYYDTDGNLVTNYVPEPLELGPLGTMKIVLERADTRGGAGAHFIVEWAAETEALEPVIESVMISTAGTQGLGFTSPGKVISGNDLEMLSGQSVYVPAYSEVFFVNTKRTWDLAVTLAIHNTDPNHPINISSVRYYDIDGNMVNEFFDDPVNLNPWATKGVVLERTDSSGGIGANFIVDWEASDPVSEPVIEAVLVSTSGTQALGFTAPGRIISQSP